MPHGSYNSTLSVADIICVFLHPCTVRVLEILGGIIYTSTSSEIIDAESVVFSIYFWRYFR